MNILCFTLKGNNAFFKKPDVNTYLYYTYGHIHKVALLGMFGAILGYGGYYQQNMIKKGNFVADESMNGVGYYNTVFPEFYTRLHDINISIVPKCEKGKFPKKIQSFNNSVGYASCERGGNLITKEQWIDSPEWEVYLLIDCMEAETISEFIMNKKCIYMPYLGKNDHPADIYDTVIIRENKYVDTPVTIDSLFPDKDVIYDDVFDDDIYPFMYIEYLPTGLTHEANMYELTKTVFTNMRVISRIDNVYKVNEKNICFY